MEASLMQGLFSVAAMISTSEVRGRIVHWQANERHMLSIVSEIFQVLLILPAL